MSKKFTVKRRQAAAASVARHAEVDETRARRDAQCAACATSDGCDAHEMFTCANCGALVPWADGGSDDEFGLGGDECSSCYVARTMVAAIEDAPITVTIDVTADVTAVQINGLCEAPPLLAPDAAEQLAENLVLGADAARQAMSDGYCGPAMVVPLKVDEKPSGIRSFDDELIERIVEISVDAALGEVARQAGSMPPTLMEARGVGIAAARSLFVRARTALDEPPSRVPYAKDQLPVIAAHENTNVHLSNGEESAGHGDLPCPDVLLDKAGPIAVPAPGCTHPADQIKRDAVIIECQRCGKIWQTPSWPPRSACRARLRREP